MNYLPLPIFFVFICNRENFVAKRFNYNIEVQAELANWIDDVEIIGSLIKLYIDKLLY